MKKKQASLKSSVITPDEVAKIARLAHIHVTDEEQLSLSKGFNTTIEVVNQLFQVDVAGVIPMGHVTGVENVYRKDDIDGNRILTQEQALSNTKRAYIGFFVVDQILNE